MRTWVTPSVDIGSRSLSTNSSPFILLGAAVVGIGGWLYCDIRYGKSFSASVGIVGYSVNVSVGCR